MDKTLKIDDLVMKTLAFMSVDRINRLICNTNQGALELEIRKGEKNYHFVLGAVPLKDDVSKELMGILFPIKALEVPQVMRPARTVVMAIPSDAKTATTGKIIKLMDVPKKRMGRPRGSKDGIKKME